MGNAVITRQVDNLGRIVLPIEYRKILDIEPGDALDMELTEDSIIFKKAIDRCMVCKTKENLKKFKDKMFCETCLEELKNI